MNTLSVQAKPPHPQGTGRGAIAVAHWRTSKGFRPLTPRAQAPLQRTRERGNVFRQMADPPEDSGGSHPLWTETMRHSQGRFANVFRICRIKQAEPATSGNFRKRFQLQPLTVSAQTVYKGEILPVRRFNRVDGQLYEKQQKGHRGNFQTLREKKRGNPKTCRFC